MREWVGGYLLAHADTYADMRECPHGRVCKKIRVEEFISILSSLSFGTGLQEVLADNVHNMDSANSTGDVLFQKSTVACPGISYRECYVRRILLSFCSPYPLVT